MIGKSVIERFGSTAGKAASTAGLAAVGMYGFSKGLKSSGAGDAFYDMTTGNPNIDEDVLGTNISPMSLLLSLPGSRADVMANGRPFARSGLPRLMATIPTGMVNNKMISGAYSKTNQPFVTTPNSMPRPDGSLVFGMNNSRHGG